VPETLHVLRYRYVPDILARRGPYRDAHLGLLRRLHAEGAVVTAGATGDPPSGALIVFRDAGAAERFAREDPYGSAGLVAERSVEPWTVVVP